MSEAARLRCPVSRGVLRIFGESAMLTLEDWGPKMSAVDRTGESDWLASKETTPQNVIAYHGDQVPIAIMVTFSFPFMM